MDLIIHAHLKVLRNKPFSHRKSVQTIAHKNPLNPLDPNSGPYPEPELKSAIAKQDR